MIAKGLLFMNQMEYTNICDHSSLNIDVEDPPIERDAGVPAVFDACCKKWAIRALIEMGGHTNVIRIQNCSEPGLLRYLGVGANLENFYDQALVLSAVKEKYKELTKPQVGIPVNTTLYKNVTWLGSQLGLSVDEKKILLLCVLEKQNIFLRQSLSSIGDMTQPKLMGVISTLLDIPLRRVHDAFSEQSTLTRTGLLFTNTYLEVLDFGAKIDLISGLAESLMEEQRNFFDIFSSNFVVSPKPILTLSDYAHVSQKVENIIHLLKTSISTHRIGTNVLIYGPPGTGKSELARVIAHSIGADAFEVTVGGKPGERYSNVNRLSAYMLSQTILSKAKNKLIIFDECEDIAFRRDDEDHFSKSQRSGTKGMKGAMNQLLTTSDVPAIFITNDLGCFQDRAYLRRMDLCLRLDVPPVGVRTQMLRTFTNGMNVSDEWCKQTASNEAISPAMMAKAVNVACAIQASNSNSKNESVLTDLLESSLTAQSFPVKSIHSNGISLPYCLDYVNTDVELQEITESLKTHSEARLLLYGVSGTGKSAYAKHLAETIGKPALIKQASDIFSKYVGDTEKSIARVFKEAEEEDAVLILDEADSYLRDRTQGLKGYEMTMINEMLTQIEMYKGIFIATTNLSDGMDQAAMRRFDAKIHFNYLKPDQASKMMLETCRILNINDYVYDESIQKCLTQLSPEDFAVVIRQAKFKKISTYVQVLKILDQEKAMKRLATGGSIGFLAH